MPTYEYRCDACGAEFERVQRMTEEPKNDCLKCGALSAKRMISQGNFILKGGGWYGDLYAGGSNKRDGASSSASTSSASTSSASTTAESSCAKGDGPSCGACPAVSAASTTN